jgi:hypothetical protein
MDKRHWIPAEAFPSMIEAGAGMTAFIPHSEFRIWYVRVNPW